MTQTSDVSNDATRANISNDVSKTVEARGGACRRVEAREKELRCVGARVARDQRNSNFERHMEARAVSDGV